MFFVPCVSHAFASVHCCLVVTCWERTDILALVGDVYCIFVTFPSGILGQVWYLIVSIPDLCLISCFKACATAIYKLIINYLFFVGAFSCFVFCFVFCFVSFCFFVSSSFLYSFFYLYSGHQIYFLLLHCFV